MARWASRSFALLRSSCAADKVVTLLVPAFEALFFLALLEVCRDLDLEGTSLCCCLSMPDGVGVESDGFLGDRP